MAGIKIKSVRKNYGSVEVIKGVDIDIADGEFVVFVGPSGCGKSTLLRMIAGLEEITGGEIEIGGRVVNEVAPAKRGVAMVFQSYALYPHMSVYNNMAFGLKQAKMPKDEIDKRVRAAAESLKLTDYLDRSPRALSGGQRQRVAIARAIVRDPEAFLFDEPLSNLDAALRVSTRLEIARLHERLGATMVYVTHDQVEAMTLADKIVVLRDGEVEQIGAPLELYEKPRNLFVAGFIGSPNMNIFAKSDLGAAGGGLISDAQKLGVRPEHLEVAEASSAIVSGRLELVEQLGEYSLLHLLTKDGEAFTAKMPRSPSLSHGAEMHFNAAQSNLHRFDASSGLRVN